MKIRRGTRHCVPDEVAQPLGSVFREGRFEDEGESGDRSFAGRGIALRGSEAVRKMGLCPFYGQPFFAFRVRAMSGSTLGGLWEEVYRIREIKCAAVEAGDP